MRCMLPGAVCILNFSCVSMCPKAKQSLRSFFRLEKLISINNLIIISLPGL